MIQFRIHEKFTVQSPSWYKVIDYIAIIIIIQFVLVVKDEDAKIGCFAYGSTVRTQNRGVIPVEQVKTGDVVESLSESNTVIYAPVIMIMHQVCKSDIGSVVR